MSEPSEASRLFLVTPAVVDPASFPLKLEAALAGGRVAAVLVALDAASAGAAEVAARLVPIIQHSGAAALVADDTRLAGRSKADGVHVGSGLADLRLAIESCRPERIVGAGHLLSRHAAMQAGEAGADYVFFGRPHGDTHDAPHPKALALAEWWAELMEIPAVIMAGRSLAGVAEAAATGADFVALNAAVWTHPEGPSEAVRIALAALERPRRAA
jgi:thiamine-phosphate pyrophosphorylase